MVPPSSDRIARVPPYSRTRGALRVRGCHPLRPAVPGRSACAPQATGLLRFRSPLLAESRLMSSPPGTEMFQFPGFAPPPYGFGREYPQRGWVAPFGDPRINARSRLPVAFRSVPRPSSPPGAKASTECPSLARERTTPRGAQRTPRRGRHAQEPPPAQKRAAGAPAGLTPNSHTHDAPDPGRPQEAPDPRAGGRAPGQTRDRQTQRRTKP